MYCVEAIVDKLQYVGMCNIGTRPTFYDNSNQTIEVQFLDETVFNSNYNQLVNMGNKSI